MVVIMDPISDMDIHSITRTTVLEDITIHIIMEIFTLLITMDMEVFTIHSTVTIDFTTLIITIGTTDTAIIIITEEDMLITTAE